MFHEQTGYDFGNSRRSQEDARSPDAAVRVPAIAHLKKIACQLTPSLSEKDGILRSLQKDGLDGGDHTNQLVACCVCGRLDSQKISHQFDIATLLHKICDVYSTLMLTQG